VPVVIETVDVELELYCQTPARQPLLTKPEELQYAIRGLKVGKAPGPNGIPNRAPKHHPMRAVLLLVHLFKAIICIHHFPPVCEHARVISKLKPRKNPTQPSSYRPISLVHKIGKLFKKILLTRILHQVGECGLLRDEQFEWRLLCIIDELFVFTQITVTNMVAVCFCFTLNI
jgi:hypothetical protein